MIEITFINPSTQDRVELSITIDTNDSQCTYIKRIGRKLLFRAPFQLHEALERLAKETKYYYLDGWIPVLTIE